MGLMSYAASIAMVQPAHLAVGQEIPKETTKPCVINSGQRSSLPDCPTAQTVFSYASQRAIRPIFA
ncbi:hypothetical protein DPMN_111469 [Dreissena polymorpha]|uniref:Uncharacterized protein n=1 Tax=Dreissena polymorpha TaxID=45954 RepID=A0A9D4QP19_DREPO|nr:hypothetical protein DPMN_111469 [Dreissena polymorpha]